MKLRALIPVLLWSSIFTGGCERKTAADPIPKDRVELPAYLRVSVTMNAISVDDTLLREAYPEHFEGGAEQPQGARHVLSLKNGRIAAIEHDRTSHEIEPLSKILDEKKRELATLGQTKPAVLENLLVVIDPEVPQQTAASVLWTSRHRGGRFDKIHLPLQADASTAKQLLATTPSRHKTLAHDDRSRTTQDNIIKCLAPTIVSTPEGISVKVVLTTGPSDGVYYSRMRPPKKPGEESEVALSLENSPALRVLGNTESADLGALLGERGFGHGTQSPLQRANSGANRAVSRAIYRSTTLATRPLHHNVWLGESCPMIPANLSRAEQIEKLRGVLVKIQEVYPICYNGTDIASRKTSWSEVTPILEALAREGVGFESTYEQDKRQEICTQTLSPALYVDLAKAQIWREREERDRKRAARKQKRSP